jgi:hypothetical protein
MIKYYIVLLPPGADTTCQICHLMNEDRQPIKSKSLNRDRWQYFYWKDKQNGIKWYFLWSIGDCVYWLIKWKQD